jgi:hypothetical protein
MSTEREGADCKYIEIMQILPGSSANRVTMRCL